MRCTSVSSKSISRSVWRKNGIEEKNAYIRLAVSHCEPFIFQFGSVFVSIVHVLPTVVGRRVMLFIFSWFSYARLGWPMTNK